MMCSTVLRGALTVLVVVMCVVRGGYTTTTTSASTSSSTSSLPSECRLGHSAMRFYPTEKRVYQHLTCYACYTFIPGHRRNHTLPVEGRYETLSSGVQHYVIRFKVEDKMYYFDPDDTEGWSHVRASMATRVEADKLEDCCSEAVYCCRETLNDPINEHDDEGDEASSSSSGWCPRTWDGWSCFPPTPAATTLTVTCPHHAYTGYAECTLTGQARCTENGMWAQNNESREHTDYTACSHRPYHLANYHWEAAAHIVSVLALIPAITLILAYRQLKVQRFFLHVSLFVALLGEAVLATLDVWLIRTSEYTQGVSHLDENSVWCRLVVTCRKVFGVAVWCCMLAQSIYLHRLIVAAFKGGGKTWVYLVVGWVPAVVVVSVWAVCRALLENYQCWLGDDQNTSADLFLITEVPKFIILIINTILLANMTRVLMTKLRGVGANQPSTSRRAVKATAFLLPMFGLQFFLPLYVPPPSTSCRAMQVYFFLAMAVDGLQGLYVATVYCFINKEVKLQVCRSLHRVKGRWATDRPTNTTDWDPHTNVSVLSSTSQYHHTQQPSSPQPEEIPLTTTST